MTYTEASMDVLRQAGDELADATVATLFERGEVGKFNTLMRYVSTAGAPLPEAAATSKEDQSHPHTVWLCPRCHGSMLILERWTASQLRFRSPPNLHSTAA